MAVHISEMVCVNCGKELPEDAAFCPSCGNRSNQEAPKEEENETLAQTSAESVTADVAQAPAETAVAAEPEAPVEAEAPKPVDHKKKKKLFAGIGAAVIAIALVAALLASPLFTVISGSAVKIFGSDADYYRYLEKEAIPDSIEAVGNVYGQYYELLSSEAKASGVETSVKVALGEELEELIVDAIGQDLDLSFVNDMTFKFSAANSKDISKVLMGVSYQDQSLLTVEAFMNLVENEIFMAIPEFSKDYLFADLGSLIPDLDAESPVNPFDLAEEIKELLPEQKRLESIAKKYVNIALDAIGDDQVKESTETFEIEGVSQKVTVLTVEITDAYLADAAEKILKALKDDDDVKAIVNDLSKLAKEVSGGLYSGDLWQGFQDSVDQLIAELDPTLFAGVDLKLVSYVDSTHNIIGRSVINDGQKVISAITVAKGAKTATELEIADLLILSGSGTVKSSKTTGTYVLKVSGTAAQTDSAWLEIGTVELEDFQVKTDAKTPKIQGSISIKPGKSLLENAAGSNAALVSLLKLSVKMDFGKDSFGLSAYTNESLLAGITVTTKDVSAKKLTMPDKGKAFDLTNEDAVMQWLSKGDIQPIVDAVTKLPLPEDVIAMIRQLPDMLDQAA